MGQTSSQNSEPVLFKIECKCKKEIRILKEKNFVLNSVIKTLECILGAIWICEHIFNHKFYGNMVVKFNCAIQIDCILDFQNFWRNMYNLVLIISYIFIVYWNENILDLLGKKSHTAKKNLICDFTLLKC